MQIPNHWSSAIPKKCERNITVGHPLRAKLIPSNFKSKILHIKKKYLSVNFSCNFVEIALNFLNKMKIS